MTLRKHITNLTIILSVIYYIVDSIIDATLVYDDLGFFQVFLTAIPFSELYSRLLTIAAIVVLGLLIASVTKKNEQQPATSGKKENYTGNPMLMVNVSNHIRTPLNAIQGFVELLKDPGINESSKRLYINHISTSSKYLLELINNVTDITLLETNGMYLDESDCKINELFTEIHTRYTNLIREKDKRDLGIILKTNVKDADFTIRADEKRLRQIVSNLIENSITFTDEGVIEFGYFMREEGQLDFFVKDDGSGISAERLELMFSQLTSVIDNRMAPFDLVSLRINIARRLIRLMGGELEAKSELEVGSEFNFSLSLEVEQIVESAKVEEEEEIAVQEKSESKKGDMEWSDKTVLIAEDVESNFIYLQEILKETGMRVLWAENGKIAVDEALSNSDIDLILMDILMPEMDGYEATVKIKKELPHLPVIAQTAYHLDETDYKDAKHYFDKILIKPIWSYDLLNALKECFNKN